MPRGGYPSLEDAGISCPGRDELRCKIDALGEGKLFSLVDIAGDNPELAEAFAATRGYDHVHVIDDLHTGIVETRYLRRLPRLDLFLDEIRNRFSTRIVETGDRVAWRLGLTPWEPILGHRYYSDVLAADMSFGKYMFLRFSPAPGSWALKEDPAARLVRAFFDMPEKSWPSMAAAARDDARSSLTPDILSAAPALAVAASCQEDIPEDASARLAALSAFLEKQTEIAA